MPSKAFSPSSRAGRIRRGTFTSVAALQDAIRSYIQEHNKAPKPPSSGQNLLTTILAKIKPTACSFRMTQSISLFGEPDQIDLVVNSLNMPGLMGALQYGALRKNACTSSNGGVLWFCSVFAHAVFDVSSLNLAASKGVAVFFRAAFGFIPIEVRRCLHRALWRRGICRPAA